MSDLTGQPQLSHRAVKVMTARRDNPTPTAEQFEQLNQAETARQALARTGRYGDPYQVQIDYVLTASGGDQRVFNGGPLTIARVRYKFIQAWREVHRL